MVNLEFSHGEYQGLTIQESILISQFFENYDQKLLAELVRDDIRMSEGMRLFIHDVIIGVISRPIGAKNKTFYRDLEIHSDIVDLMDSENIPLTSNAQRNGAAFIIGERYGLTEGTAARAYGRIAKAWKVHNDIDDEELNGKR